MSALRWRTAAKGMCNSRRLLPQLLLRPRVPAYGAIWDGRCRSAAAQPGSGAAPVDAPATEPPGTDGAFCSDAVGNVNDPGLDGQAAALGLRTAADACSLWGQFGLPAAQQRGSKSRRRVAQLLHDIMGVLSLLPTPAVRFAGIPSCRPYTHPPPKGKTDRFMKYATRCPLCKMCHYVKGQQSGSGRGNFDMQGRHTLITLVSNQRIYTPMGRSNQRRSSCGSNSPGRPLVQRCPVDSGSALR